MNATIYRNTNADSRPVSNQLIVKLKPEVQSTQALDLQKSLGASVIETTKQWGYQLWSVTGMSIQAALAELKKNPNVEYAELNYLLETSSIPNDVNFNKLWAINNTGQTGGTPDADIDGLEAYNLANGEGVVVGVIDTGVDYTHPDLVNNMWTNPGEVPNNGIDDDGNGYIDDYYGYDFVNEDSDPLDENYHGTHVAGIIAAEGNNLQGVIGVAPKTKIMALKFLNGQETGNIFDAIQAIEYATMMKLNYGVNVQILNNSWSGGQYSQALHDAIAAANAAGQLFTASAGNGHNNNDLLPVYPASYDLENIISVAATDDQDQLADFSNYGATTVDLAAPGVQIYSTWPGNNYASSSGTSMSTAYVSGVASLIYSLNPNLTPAQVKSYILSGVEPVSSLQGITVSGGRLNAYKALLSPLAAKITGSLWNDLDQNGVRDAGEPGLAGWKIYLDQNNNGTFDPGERSTVTNKQGDYAFLLLSPGNYTVREVKQLGWTQTNQTDLYYTVQVAESQTVSGINWGNFLAQPATISGTKWNDLNQNAVLDSGEPGLAGWTIYLDENGNSQLDTGELSTVTDEQGKYSFTNLAPGNYQVNVVNQNGWQQTQPVSGSYSVALSPDEVVNNINFGHYELKKGEIRGIKWNDLDGDGIRDQGEPGLPGMTIYLDQNQNGRLDNGEISALTDKDGNYAFTNLTPGITYTVAEVLQANWAQTTPRFLFNADFSDAQGNASLDGFTIDNNYNGLWHLSTGRGNQAGHSADDSLYFGTKEGIDGGGNYDVGSTSGRITSSEISLIGLEDAQLSFNYFLQTEGGGFYDQAKVLLSQNGGDFFQIASNQQSLQDPTPGWTNLTLDLTAYTGSKIKIRFDFDSIDYYANNFEGWYIDDITVTNAAGQGIYTVKLDPGQIVNNINFGNYQPVKNGTWRNDELIGTKLKDIINGLAGNDNLYGKEDNDVLNGGGGNDNLYGNEGNDELNGNEGKDYLEGNQGNDSLNGGSESDNLLGNEGNDTLKGGTHNDTLWGNQGNDILNGDEGNDLLYGNEGQDTLKGGSNNDTLYGNEDNDLLSGDESNDQLYGDQGNDILNGDAGNDALYGSTGNDTLSGGVGRDTLYGNENNDLLNGDDDHDLLYGNQDNDTLNGGNGNDTLYGNEGSDILNGGNNNDSLYGNEGNDTLNGAEGNDTLRGGEGNDLLTGGLDKDVFVLAANFGSDTITDFMDGQDKLGLSAGLSFAQLTLTSNQSNTLIYLTSSNELLATLSGINLSLINSRDFMVI
ncbi:S8 family serine peptidase [Gloeothece verrucosa]|nr:S8 family serine peptidase [Gloeothece verrucosa]